MTRLKRQHLNSLALALLCGLVASESLWAGEASGGPYTLTKDLVGASGTHALSGGIYTLGYSFGEQTASVAIGDTTRTVLPGYYGGAFGSGHTFQLTTSHVGTAALMQDGIQVGVPLQASITIDFF